MLDFGKVKKKVYELVEKNKKNFKKSTSASGYVTKRDEGIIKKFCKENKVSISFRDAGVTSLKRIEEGYPCKGHEIMDKTIKEKNGEWTYKIIALKDKEEEKTKLLTLLNGFVGYHTGDKDLKGVRCLKKAPHHKEIEGGGGGYYVPYDKIDTTYLEKNEKYLYTGDYDLHDIKFSAAFSILEEKNLLNKLAKALDRNIKGAKVDSIDSPYSQVRHGPQTKFISFLNYYKGEIERETNTKS